jgi:hypothetical protein
LSDGASAAQHLESGLRQFKALGITPKSTTITEPAPPFPFEIEYLWRWFWEIMDGVSGNGMTAPILTWEGIATWAQLMGLDPEPWECRALIRLSNARAIVFLEQQAKDRGSKNAVRSD